MADSTFVLTGAYYDVRGRWTSRLTLNNKGADPARPVVTLYSPNGEAYIVPDIEISANDFLDLDLGRIARGAGPAFQQGSLRVAYYGKRLEMGAEVVIADLDRGLQFDEQFSYAPPGGSSRREAVWWRPTAATRLSLVLTNRSEQAIAVRAGLAGAAPRSGVEPGANPRPDRADRRDVTLGPHELRVLEFGAALEQVGRQGGLSVEFDGPPDALLARGFLADPATGYSASVGFSDPTKGATSAWHGAGARLRTPAGEATEPVLVARNVGGAATRLQGRLVLSRADGPPDVWFLPEVSIAPGETALVPAAEVWRAAAARPDVTAAGLEFSYTTAAGSVIMSAAAVGADRNEVFQVPLIDPDTPPSSTGGYPWRVGPAGGESTVVYLKNTTMAEQMYLLQVSWQGGAYAPGLKTLAPGETFALDLRHLRDAQVPDRLGRTIPIDVAGGQVHSSAKSRERHAIIGRAETVDPEHAVSSTYACVNCCPDNPYDSWTAPGSLALGPGITDVLVAWLRDIDCYDTILEAYDLGPGQLQWSSSNTNVATVSWGEVTGVGEGTANIYGTYSTNWWWEQNTDCESEPYNVVYTSQVKTQVPTSLAIVTGLSDLCSNPPSCQPPGCTGGCQAYYYKYRDYQVMDGTVPPQPIQKVMQLNESFTTPTNTCGATFLTGNATTNTAGIFRDSFFFYGNGVCAGGGSCTVVRNQAWTEVSSSNTVGTYTLTYTCNSFSIQ